MPKDQWFSRHFFVGILQNATWDAAKQIVRGGALTSLGAAAWQYIRHRSVDWWGVLGLFILTVIVLFLSRPKPPVAVASDAMPASEPLLSKERSIFTEHQIRAFELAKDLGRLQSIFDEQPSVNIADYPRGEGFLQATVMARGPWALKLNSTFAADFAPRLNQVLLDFGKQGLHDPSLTKLVNRQLAREDDIREIRARLVQLAYLQEGLVLKTQ